MTGRSPRLLLGLASVAVAFAAADTYVVVLALPDMMTSVGVEVVALQRAAPIVSGFLLGYVAMLPLIGRIADLRGRVPVLVMALVVFALGSLVTALAYDMPSIVVGRFLQGVGGGGLVPATLALVADLYPAHRRGVPLGIVSAVQELGSVIGPLFGALVLSVADWRAIFAINLAVGLVLAAAIRTLAPGDPDAPDRASDEPRPRPDYLGAALLLVTLVAGVLVFVRPSPLMQDLTWGQLFIPFSGDGRWLTPVGVVALVAAPLFVLRCLTARRPLVDLRGWGRSMVEADLPGALLLARGPLRGDPGLRHRRPQGAGLLRPGALVPPRVGGRHRPLRPAPAPRGRPPRPARCAPPYPRLGVAAGELLRRRRAHRRPDRHPALRAHHDLPRLPARRGVGAGAVPGRAARRRGARRLPHPSAARRGRHRGRDGAGRPRASC